MPSFDTVLSVAIQKEPENVHQANGYRSMSTTANATLSPKSPTQRTPLSTSAPPQTTPPLSPTPKLHPKLVWQTVDAVCFDVDSTVCRDEAIDELADFCGVGEQVAEMTRIAMNGNMTFRQALTTRLNIIRPSIQDVNRFLAANPPRLTEGIVELVQALHKRRIPVYLVTGGFRRIVEPVARLLHIPLSNIFANDLFFDPKTGQYSGFDHNQPTSDSGGKTLVCSKLKRSHGYKHLAMIGDGATDAETAAPTEARFLPGADAFIGFGGNVARPGVLAQAKWFVYDFAELVDEFPALNKENKA